MIVDDPSPRSTEGSRSRSKGGAVAVTGAGVGGGDLAQVTWLLGSEAGWLKACTSLIKPKENWFSSVWDDWEENNSLSLRSSRLGILAVKGKRTNVIEHKP